MAEEDDADKIVEDHDSQVDDDEMSPAEAGFSKGEEEAAEEEEEKKEEEDFDEDDVR